jgi:hypothetical protein
LWHIQHWVRAELGMYLGNSANIAFIRGTIRIGAFFEAFQSAASWQCSQPTPSVTE